MEEKRRLTEKKKDKRNFLYNPDNPDKSFDVYIDKDISDTIPIKYKVKEIKIFIYNII